MENNVTAQERFAVLQQSMLEGHCAESRAHVHNTHGSLAKMMRCYWHYIRECTRKDFPSLEHLRKYYGKAVEPYGAGIDYKGEWEATKYMMFAGDSDVKTTLKEYGVHQCWLRHNSKLSVTLYDHSYIHIDCFENTELSVTANSSDCACMVRVYGNAKVSIQGHCERVHVANMGIPTYPVNQ